MAWKLEVGGVDKTSSIHLDPSVEIDLLYNERGTARFTTLPGYIPALRSEVTIYDTDGTTKLFGGVIWQRESSGNYQAGMFTECECVDWTWYLDHITVPGGEITGTYTLKAVLEWIQTYLTGYGFTLDAAQVTGPSWTVTGYEWERKTVSAALRENIGPSAQGYVFFVTPAKVWGMKKADLTTADAPFTITDGSGTSTELQWRETSENYATKIIVRYGGSVDPQEAIADALVSPAIERIITADDVTNATTAQALADGYLVALNQSPRTFEIDTLTGGLLPGQVISINSTIRSVSSMKAQITRVGIALQTDTFWRYRAEATSGVYQGSALDAWRGGGGGTTAVMVGGGSISGQALTKTDDTNVTLTLGGSASTALVNAASLTLGWTGTLAMTRGGTAASLTAAHGAIAYSTASALGLSAVGSSGQILRSAGAAAPTWSTATYPATVTVNQILHATATNVVGGSADLVYGSNRLTVAGTGGIAASGNSGTNYLANIRSSGSTVNMGLALTNSGVTNPFTAATADGFNAGDPIGANFLGGLMVWSGSLGGLAVIGASNSAGVPAIALEGNQGVSGTSRAAFWLNGVKSNGTTGKTTIDAGHALLRLANDSTTKFSVYGNGDVEFTLDADPLTNYTSNLGSLQKKYLTLHAAELWVETLVAQNTIATIGGRILVGPTTTLIVDVAPADFTITVKHNQMASGDRVYLEADGKVEWLSIDDAGAPSGGGYIYGVTRNLDGSGANQWYAGDAVFNTGTTGDGFIDLYSISGVRSVGIGPTIVGNVRTGTTYSATAPRWAVGNLNGIADYAADIYGAFFGDSTATNLTIDATNGFRIRSGTTNKLVADTSGVLTIGAVASGQSNVLISAGALELRNNTTVRTRLASDGSGYLGSSTGITWDTSGNLSVAGTLTVGTGGAIASGATAYGTGTGIWAAYNAGTPQFRVGIVSGNRLAWDGTDLTVVSANVTIDTNGVVIEPHTGTFAYQSTRSYRWATATGNNGISGFDSSVNGRGMLMEAKWTGTGDRLNRIWISADNAPSSGGTADFADMEAFADGVAPAVTLRASHGGNVSLMEITATRVAVGKASGGGSFLFLVNSSTPVQMANYGAGTATFDASGNITSSSDLRLKTDVELYPAGLREVLALKPIAFRWTEHSGLDCVHRYVGFGAQDVQTVLKYATGVDSRGYFTLNDRAITAALVGAVRELFQEVTTLRAKVKVLREEPK